MVCTVSVQSREDGKVLCPRGLAKTYISDASSRNESMVHKYRQWHGINNMYGDKKKGRRTGHEQSGKTTGTLYSSRSLNSIVYGVQDHDVSPPGTPRLSGEGMGAM